MKTTTFLIFSWCYLNAFGQINLENTYNEGLVTRVVLENSGEKYYLYDATAKLVKLYNADHSPWKAIPLPTFSNPLDLTIEHLSETKINADPDIEIAFRCTSGIGSYYYTFNYTVWV